MFEKGGTRSLIISTLEALAVLFALKLRFGETPPTKRTKIASGSRFSCEQAGVATLPRDCLVHGNGSLHQMNGVGGSCRMVFSRRGSRSRQAGE